MFAKISRDIYPTRVRSPLPTSRVQCLFLTALLGILPAVPTQAAVTVTVDTLAQTVTWSGTATSPLLVIAESDYRSIRLGFGDWTGGESATSSFEQSLNVSLSPQSDWQIYLGESFASGQIVLAHSRDSFYTQLGFLTNTGSFSGGPLSASLTISGDGVARSYAGLTASSLEFLESLDGTALYFQDDYGGAGIFNLGGPAGQIVVVPETSSILLLLIAPLLTMRRKRCQPIS
ncbi:hypothetical protein OJ996_25960 [Luteolibacter sp. GHJ8]|uniref:PEP-CTERM sorting domain-containing protein n=1 Tax=Luteolibacter rhizosphaerae TaxID=2989719 RepID=A0ABT3GB32_9BACT|nr:hypothetical protein [Luteolibacter rhizosphaerae]MCW1917061.1 hypothetical protein [Luteolibacter rhizosphaerae]